MPNPISCHINVLVPSIADERFPRALESIASAGCDWVGLPPLSPEVDAALLGRQIADAGLRPVAFAVQRVDADVSSDDPAVRAAGEQMLRRALDDAVAMDAVHLTGAPYARHGLAEPWSRACRLRSAESIGRWADEAAAASIPLTIEVLNRYETSAINTAEQAVEYVRLTGSPHLRVHLDTFHSSIEETDLIDAVVRTVPRLGFLELGQSARGPLARGGVDVEGVVTAAVRAGYAGPIAFEAFSRPVMDAGMADRLRVWRAVYNDDRALIAEAVRMIRSAYARAA